jgi:Helix-hairpin-helix motif
MSLRLNRAGALSSVSVLVLVFLMGAAPAIAAPAPAKAAPASPVDVNTASQAQLEALPGVGTVTAKRIIAARPFSTVQDLSRAGLSVKGIQKLAPMVTVSPPPVPPSPGMVWVNPETRIFHRAGDPWYGRTRNGQWMTPADALKAGFREAKPGFKAKTPA